MAKKGWTDVPIPDGLYFELREHLDDHPELGFAGGVQEFVRDAVRRHITRTETLAHRKNGR